MIVVKLMGGLGNQLFQYASGRALAIKHNTQLKLDLSFLNLDSHLHTKRSLAIDVFNLSFMICSEKELKSFNNRSFLNKYFATVFPGNFIANEKSFEFDPAFFSYPTNTYLVGFWQSEKYFLSIRDILIKELVIYIEMPRNAIAYKNAIIKSNSVSLHVRRGDYISNKNAQDYHGNLTLDYYRKAIAYLTAKLPELEVFVFSDDINWVKSNLEIPCAHTFVEGNTGDNSVFDMELMRLCKHNIIANSSFSWWGAWLNQNPDKVVIAPEQWFADQRLNTKDLIPENWIKF